MHWPDISDCISFTPLLTPLLPQPSIVIFTDDGSNDVESEDERNVRTAPNMEENNYDPSQSYCQRKELFIDFRLVV